MIYTVRFFRPFPKPSAPLYHTDTPFCKTLLVSAMEVDGDVEETSRRIQARFVTKLDSPFRTPPTSIAIPSNLTRLGLSTIVNTLLQSGNPDWEAQPFDFLIDGELVRMSLEQFLLAKGISAEKILEIEYIKAVVPRRDEEPCLHDDWVSAVDGSSPGFILTGCYDGLGRVWNASKVCTHILEGHTGAISSISRVNHEGGEIVTVATASKDKTVKLWKVSAEEPVKGPLKITPFKILSGHTASVQSVSAQTSGEMVCSGGWDCKINLWETTSKNSDGDQVSVKKKRLNDQAHESQLEGFVIMFGHVAPSVDKNINKQYLGVNLVFEFLLESKRELKLAMVGVLCRGKDSEGEAASTLIGHTQSVSAVNWVQRETIYSASMDHSIKRWDVELGKDVLDIYCGKALNCLDVGGEGSTMIAAGGSDTVLRIWDPRKPGTSAPVFQFSSHTSWISDCKWHAKSWNHLISASYDGKVMLWDLRTAWPLCVLGSHEDKVLCADWWKSDAVVSGGADSKLCISSGVSVQ